MKTIAVTIDEGTLQLLDELAAASPRRRSRSVLVRGAVRDFVERGGSAPSRSARAPSSAGTRPASRARPRPRSPGKRARETWGDLTQLVAALSPAKLHELNPALAAALDLPAAR